MKTYRESVLSSYTSNIMPNTRIFHLNVIWFEIASWVECGSGINNIKTSRLALHMLLENCSRRRRWLPCNSTQSRNSYRLYPDPDTRGSTGGAITMWFKTDIKELIDLLVGLCRWRICAIENALYLTCHAQPKSESCISLESKFVTIKTNSVHFLQFTHKEKSRRVNWCESSHYSASYLCHNRISYFWLKCKFLNTLLVHKTSTNWFSFI